MFSFKLEKRFFFQLALMKRFFTLNLNVIDVIRRPFFAKRPKESGKWETDSDNHPR
jgi:hypothetical protein